MTQATTEAAAKGTGWLYDVQAAHLGAIAHAVTAIALALTEPPEGWVDVVVQNADGDRRHTVRVPKTQGWGPGPYKPKKHKKAKRTEGAADVCTCGHKGYQHQNYGGTLTGCEYYSGCPCEQFTPRYNATTEAADEDSLNLGNSGTESKETASEFDDAYLRGFQDGERSFRTWQAAHAASSAEGIADDHGVYYSDITSSWMCERCGKIAGPVRHGAYIALVGSEATDYE